MKKLNLAIIGQGRSGKDIHGAYYVSESNKYYNVKYVVELDEHLREVAEEKYEGCTVLTDYRELFDKTDVDLVVNATYSQTHYSITKEFLLHGKNVLVEKPLASTALEAMDLIKTAEDMGVVLAAFQQSFYGPYFTKAIEVMNSGIIGKVNAVELRFNRFSRRWDWQTIQRNVAGGLYNTGPHPVGLALAFLGLENRPRVEYSKLSVNKELTAGDGDDYAKLILCADGSDVMVDIEVSNLDAFTNYTLKLEGSRGTFKCTLNDYEMVYFVEEENPPMTLVTGSLRNANGDPIYCSEKLIKHTESGKFDGTSFDVGTALLYEELYYKITEGKPMYATAEIAAQVVAIMETVRASNPLPVTV